MSAGLMGAARNLTVISSAKEGEMECGWRLQDDSASVHAYGPESWLVPQDVFGLAVFRVNECFGLGVAEQRNVPPAHGHGVVAKRSDP